MLLSWPSELEQARKSCVSRVDMMGTVNIFDVIGQWVREGIKSSGRTAVNAAATRACLCRLPRCCPLSPLHLVHAA
jgi:hypothetical protein